MSQDELYRERVVHIDAPRSFHSVLVADDGRYVGVGDEGPGLFDYVDNCAIWTDLDGSAFGHAGGERVALASDGTLRHEGRVLAQGVVPRRGPERPPSEYLATFKEQGWVCLTAILDEPIVEGLQEAACCGAYSNRDIDPSVQPIMRTLAVARATVEPVSLWLMREYMQNHQIRFGHPPASR